MVLLVHARRTIRILFARIVWSITTTMSPAPNWVLRTAIGPVMLTEQLAVRSTGAQH